MINGLENLLENSRLPGLPELREFLNGYLGGEDLAGHLVEAQTLQPRGQRVFRLRFLLNGVPRSIVIKRLRPEIGRRNEFVCRRWLPAVGLERGGPIFLGTVAARDGAWVWHVYDDLGSWELDPREPDRPRVEAAINLISQLHLRFAQHALLGEVRLYGGDLGGHFCRANVQDAIMALEPWRPSPEHQWVRDRLLTRLERFKAELPQRLEALAELGGPETLLHGDLWAINVFVMPTGDGTAAASIQADAREEKPAKKWNARLIDWDHAAAGPVTYDLSTFLLRFPARHRHWILELYRQAMSSAGLCLPPAALLNSLFETHEYSRFANRIIWPAIALVVDEAEWGVAELIEIDKWFEQFQPVLTRESEAKI
jgi:thiamine kinase-like enzyme